VRCRKGDGDLKAGTLWPLSQARQTETSFELGGALAVGQEATMRDPMDAVRQDSGR
jgi:hypothetical protein